MAERAGPRRGWATGTFDRYGKPTAKKYQAYAATGRPTGGRIRVVRVDEPTGGVAFFCTDPTVTVADILTAAANRFSRETAFRDGKGVVRAGPPQVRFIGANVGAFPVCLWAFTMTEGWAWDRAEEGRVGYRSASPWDDESRRPGPADQRRRGGGNCWEMNSGRFYAPG